MIIREHLNKKDLPKESFDTFEETLGFINIHKLKNVLPYKCSVCGKFHYGHPERPDQLEGYKKLLQTSIRKINELKQELVDIKHQQESKHPKELKLLRRKYNKLKKKCEKYPDNFEAVIDSERNLAIENATLRQILREHGINYEEILNPIAPLLNRLPETLGDCTLRIIERDSAYKKHVKVHYVDKEGFVRVSTPCFHTCEEALKYMISKYESI